MLNKRARVLSHNLKKSYSLHRANKYGYSSVGGPMGGDLSNSSFNLGKLGGIVKPPPLIDPSINGQHYDVAVIGGGSGGLSFVYEAARLGLSVVVFDYVEPSTQGNTWGLGGTCVNVGCIPKKLMHTAALHKDAILNSYDYGWDLGELNSSLLMDPEQPEDKLFKKFKWQMLVKNVQMYIKSLNFEFKATCAENNVPYVNAMAALQDKNTLVFSPKKEVLVRHLESHGKETDSNQLGKITADYIVVATGGRPNLLSKEQCKNAEKLAITSDDVFSLKNPPGKTLVVGGGYIAVESAGFLRTIGYPVTLMTRSRYLRNFDEDVTSRLLEHMQNETKMNVLLDSLPYDMQKKENGRINVRWKNIKTNETSEEDFDTVLMAIGRYGNIKNLGLENVGVNVNTQSGKIIGGHKDETEKTNIDNIYAIGDILEGAPELTPIAKNSARLLANRISMLKNGNFDQKQYDAMKMDYTDYATTIFSPLEYSVVGYNEHDAIKRFGGENVGVYHSRLAPLEEGLVSRVNEAGEAMKKRAYFKIIVNKADNERVLGMHYLGPNAGEIMQGFGVAMKLRMTKADLDRTVGIHPTIAEEFCLLRKNKEEQPDKGGC